MNKAPNGDKFESNRSNTGEFDHDILLKVSSRASRFEREESPSIRWFSASLIREKFDYRTFNTLDAITLIECELAIISFRRGSNESLLEAAANDRKLSTIASELIETRNSRLMSRLHPEADILIVVDNMDSSSSQGIYETELLREVADYFSIVPGASILAVCVPMDYEIGLNYSFKALLDKRRVEDLLASLGMQRLKRIDAWYIRTEALRRNP